MTTYGLVGLIVMFVSEAGTLARIEPFWSWNTPIAWSGFILFADGVVWKKRGQSWLMSAPREFAALAATSIPLWLVFEFYNRFIQNWHYVNLPENQWLRYFGYAWSFSTIWPAVFESAELVAVLRGSRAAPDLPRSFGPARLGGRDFSLAAWLSMLAGVAMLASPFLSPPDVARYLAAPVWLGFIFLLDPVGARLGGESLWRDLRDGRRDRLVNLAVGGFLCGLLWESLNYWARTKWLYTVPIMERVRLFEMPLPGYLGFPAFALECFTMYVCVRLASGKPGRTIAL